jgi:hypothetical protein
MKSIISALIFATLVAATFTQPATALAQGWLDSDQSRRIYTSADYTQAGPNHTGPLYRGYPLSDWYI